MVMWPTYQKCCNSIVLFLFGAFLKKKKRKKHSSLFLFYWLTWTQKFLPTNEYICYCKSCVMCSIWGIFIAYCFYFPHKMSSSLGMPQQFLEVSFWNMTKWPRASFQLRSSLSSFDPSLCHCGGCHMVVVFLSLQVFDTESCVRTSVKMVLHLYHLCHHLP